MSERPRRKINWPKPYSPVPLDVAQTVFRIYLIDKLERKKRGYVRATPGLYHRLSKTFGIPLHTIVRLCWKMKDTKGRPTFVRIDVKKERHRLRMRKAKQDGQENHH